MEIRGPFSRKLGQGCLPGLSARVVCLPMTWVMSTVWFAGRRSFRSFGDRMVTKVRNTCNTCVLFDSFWFCLRFRVVSSLALSASLNFGLVSVIWYCVLTRRFKKILSRQHNQRPVTGIGTN